MKREFDRLYTHRNVKYTRPPVPQKWSTLKDAYEFGFVKGFFDAIRSDTPPIYDGWNERFKAFAAGYEKGFKGGKTQ